MRASKISKETSKLFGSISQPVATPRRVTRSSLSRFAYTNGSTAKEEEAQEVALGSDIEDAITTTSRKRRRVTKSASSTSTPARKIKTEEVENIATVASPSPSKPARKARKPARSATDPTTGEVTVSPPSDWEEMYNLVLEMRQPGGPASNAAVDTMGCAKLADRKVSEHDQRFQTLIALMLSSQTKDTTNAAAMKRLQTELPAHKPGAPPGLNLENILAVDPKLLNQLIWAVGFHNNKTKYIKQAAEILRDKFNGDIPPTIEGLTSLPGVGPKMAYLCMSAAWGRTEGIGVDVHVHRITNLWGWNKTSTPEATRLALQAWLPKEKWHEINWLLVGFGQTVCAPVGRKCGDCELGLRGLCKAADRAKVFEGRKRREKLKGEGIALKEEAELVIKEE